jgi:hypothetical protein
VDDEMRNYACEHLEVVRAPTSRNNARHISTWENKRENGVVAPTLIYNNLSKTHANKGTRKEKVASVTTSDQVG